MRTIASLLIATALISACAAPDKVGHAQEQAARTVNANWSVDSIAQKLAARSCPAGTRYLPPEPVQVKADPVQFGPAEELAQRLPEGVTFEGGWHLTSPNAAFGGLSGLAVLPDGNLLSVADVGEFFWLGMKDGKPDGTGKLALMRGPENELLQGKAMGDSEGLDVRGKLALVSFERTHRISAFALDACGANAREAEITALPPDFHGQKIQPNLGAEALATTPGGQIRFGIEHLGDGQSPIGMVGGPNQAGWTGRTGHDPQGYSFVGMDELKMGDKTYEFHLYRTWDPVRGTRNVVRWNDGHEFYITAPLSPRDNFEGIAAQKLQNGHVRVWIISDDNFSAHQQTLLYAFDLAPKAL